MTRPHNNSTSAPAVAAVAVATPAPPPPPLATFTQLGEFFKYVTIIVSAAGFIWQASSYMQSRQSQVDVLIAKMAVREQEYADLKVQITKLSDQIGVLTTALTELRIRVQMRDNAPTPNSGIRP